MLPHDLYENIDKVICKYWWVGSDTQQKIHWKSRATIFQAKHKGDLLGSEILE
jgi:hypothetical protein